MQNLSKQQKEAAAYHNGQEMVVSCPGSGKTTTIIERAHQMILAGISPIKILVITFTREAAKSMMARFEKEYPNDPTGICWGTIHAFCYRVLASTSGFCAENILKESEQWNFFREFIIQNKIRTDDFEDFVKNLIGEISFIRNAQIPIQKYSPEKVDKEVFRKAFKEYEEFKRRLNKIDFDDMLIMTRDLFSRDINVLKLWQSRFSYIMVDEYQDTNRIQADIIYMLAGDNGNLCIVGDDDQSIYAFRSADSSIMLDFPKKYPKCKTFYLDTNYRSGGAIIEAASRLIKGNKNRFKKDFKGYKKESGKINVYAFNELKDQATWILKEAYELQKNGGKLEDMAVLYRTNAQNQLIISQFIKTGVPFYTTEPTKDFHNDFIFGDIMAYWRLAEGNWINGDVQRILNRPSRYLKAAVFKDCSFDKKSMFAACRNVGDKMYGKALANIDELFYQVEQLRGRSPKDFLKYLLDFMDYREFTQQFADFTKRDLSVVSDLLNTIITEGEQFATMEEWSNYAKVYADQIAQSRRKSKREGVCFSTFHGAKGLEWENVYIIDANEEYSPYKKAQTPSEHEEERRMFYVAATRAASNLNISYTSGTPEHPLAPSRYLSEMGLSSAEAEPNDASEKKLEVGKKRASSKKSTKKSSSPKWMEKISKRQGSRKVQDIKLSDHMPKNVVLS